jgi:rubrerythrin
MTEEDDESIQYIEKTLELVKSCETIDDFKEKSGEFLDLQVEAIKVSIVKLREVLELPEEERQEALQSVQEDNTRNEKLQVEIEKETARIAGLEGGDEFMEGLAEEFVRRADPLMEEMAELTGKLMGSMMGDIMGDLGKAMGEAFGGLGGEEEGLWCPACGEILEEENPTSCPHCNAEFPEKEEEGLWCPACGKILEEENPTSCPHCNAEFGEKAPEEKEE